MEKFMQLAGSFLKTFIKGKRPGKTNLKHNQDGFILFSLLIIGMLIIVLAMNTSVGMQNSMRTAGTHRIKENVFNIAEAGKEHALSLFRMDSVAMNPNQDWELISNRQFSSGSYTVRCITNSAMDTLLLRSTGAANNQSAGVEIKCHRYTMPLKTSYNFPAAVCSKSNITDAGTILIDGNDYDTNTEAIRSGGNNVFGIATCGTYVGKGTADVCGNGCVYNKKTPCPEGTVIKTSCNPTVFPKTPEEVLGLPAGALDAFKTASPPSSIFHGIVYVTGPGEISPDLGDCSGIFIYHDSTYNSILKNINYNKGMFKGVIICDNISKINGKAAIMGAVVTLSSTPEGNAFGNGTANIYYSSQVINNLPKYYPKLKPQVEIISWKEL
jgi:hypothetical protein